MSYRVISLFTGCGGLDLGFKGGFSYLDRHFPSLDFTTIFANDIDHNACETFKQNFQISPICGDIRELLAELPNSTDILLGGFPCQDFSHAGKRLGFSSERGVLYQSMCQAIKKSKPKLFIAENVKGLLTINNGDSIKTIVNDFKELGYNVSYKLISVCRFGVPQKRERVIIVGSLAEKLPLFDFEKYLLPTSYDVNAEDAISDLTDLAEGVIPNHFWSKAKKNNGQGNNIINKDDYAPTIRAEHHGNIEFHWNGARRLSAREAARLQSFPDDFIFYPSTSSAYKQIGNAVPPVFAWHLATSIQKFLLKHLSS
jgi:DNA (cytosine-5)-methyltransferase 1